MNFKEGTSIQVMTPYNKRKFLFVSVVAGELQLLSCFTGCFTAYHAWRALYYRLVIVFVFSALMFLLCRHL